MIVRDPIYGLVKLSETVSAIYRLPVVQRLRNISQVGFGDVIYPSCRHNRLEHSIGTYHLCSLLVNENENVPPEFPIACLLHDIGHGPFSHVFETIYPWYDHEDMTIRIFDETPIPDVLSSNSYDPRIVHEILAKKSVWSTILYGSEEFPYGIDRLDYFNRDGYHSLGYVMFESDYVLKRLVIRGDEVDLVVGADVFRDLYVAVRKHLYLSLYLHPARALFTAYTAYYARRIADHVIDLVERDGPLGLDDYVFATMLRRTGWSPYTSPPRRSERVEVYEYGYDDVELRERLGGYYEAVRETCPNCHIYGVVTRKVLGDRYTLVFYVWLHGKRREDIESALRRDRVSVRLRKVVGLAEDPLVSY